MRTSNCSLAAFVVALVASAPAFAQPTEPQDLGEQAYQRGRQHYDLQDWDQAITEFKEAYRLRSDAASLFNIAQSYRLKGDCAQAASFYKTYRRNFPAEKNIARVDHFIAEMDACIKQAPAIDSTTPGDAQPPTDGSADGTAPGAGSPGAASNAGNTATSSGAPLPAGPIDAPAPTMNRPLVIAGIAAGVVGIGGVIGGVWAGSRAQDIATDIELRPVWDPALHERGQRYDLAAKILVSAGSAALIGSGVLFYLGLRGSEPDATTTSLRVVPQTDGATLLWGGSL
jgi:tetratricopeptide (TPR) repeat protein